MTSDPPVAADLPDEGAFFLVPVGANSPRRGAAQAPVNALLLRAAGQVGTQSVAEREQVLRHRFGPVIEDDNEVGTLRMAEFDGADPSTAVKLSRIS